MSILRFSRYQGSRFAPTEDNEAIRRRRSCVNCKRRFTTYERYEDIALVVVKKDNIREPFNRTKLLNGLVRLVKSDRLRLVN